MRTDPRYTRVRKMLTDEVVPRMKNGGLALCHFCQRRVYFAGGLIELLAKIIRRNASFAPSLPEILKALPPEDLQRALDRESAAFRELRRRRNLRSSNNSDGRSP